VALPIDIEHVQWMWGIWEEVRNRSSSDFSPPARAAAWKTMP